MREGREDAPATRAPISFSSSDSPLLLASSCARRLRRSLLPSDCAAVDPLECRKHASASPARTSAAAQPATARATGVERPRTVLPAVEAAAEEAEEEVESGSSARSKEEVSSSRRCLSSRPRPS